MLLFYQLHHLSVNFGLSFGGAGQGGISAKVLVTHCFHRYHIKTFAHSITSDHGQSQLGCLLNIVGSPG